MKAVSHQWVRANPKKAAQVISDLNYSLGSLQLAVLLSSYNLRKMSCRCEPNNEARCARCIISEQLDAALAESKGQP